MLERILIYRFVCDRCKNEQKSDFYIGYHEEFPILDDPPKGWVKINELGFSKHWCPGCVDSIEWIRS